MELSNHKPININEDKARMEAEINLLFDIAEKPIIDFLLYYLDLKAEDALIETDYNYFYKELMLQEEEEKVCFRLAMVPSSYKNILPNNITNEYKETINLFKKAVEKILECLNLNLNEMTALGWAMASLHFTFNESDNTFIPKYIHPIRRQYLSLTETSEKLKLIYSRNNILPKEISEEDKQKWDDIFAQINTSLNGLNLEDEMIKENEKTINEKLKNSNKLAILFREIPNQQS